MCASQRRSIDADIGSSHSSDLVQHNYHDYSHVQAPDYVNKNMVAAPSGPAGEPFPVRLLHVLDQIEADGLGHIISWQPHGRCFVIRNPDRFKEILPKYFNQSKIASFQRQLSLYGFQRITQRMDKGGYYHELFLRGKEFLAHQILRTKVKGTKVRAKANPDQEPDFWSMEWVLDTRSNKLVVAGSQRRTSSITAETTPLHLQTEPHDISQHITESEYTTRSNTNEENIDIRMAPLCSPASVAIPSLLGEEQRQKESMQEEFQEEMLCRWGKSFYALDDLPDDLHLVVASSDDQRRTNASAPPSCSSPRSAAPLQSLSHVYLAPSTPAGSQQPLPVCPPTTTRQTTSILPNDADDEDNDENKMSITDVSFLQDTHTNLLLRANRRSFVIDTENDSVLSDILEGIADL